MARSIATTRRNVRDYQHKLCRANLAAARQQQALCARLAVVRRIGNGTIRHRNGPLKHL